MCRCRQCLQWHRSTISAKPTGLLLAAVLPELVSRLQGGRWRANTLMRQGCAPQLVATCVQPRVQHPWSSWHASSNLDVVQDSQTSRGDFGQPGGSAGAMGWMQQARDHEPLHTLASPDYTECLLDQKARDTCMLGICPSTSRCSCTCFPSVRHQHWTASTSTAQACEKESLSFPLYTPACCLPPLPASPPLLRALFTPPLDSPAAGAVSTSSSCCSRSAAACAGT